jgi:DNA-binding NarL/FixJ family response regulator
MVMFVILQNTYLIFAILPPLHFFLNLPPLLYLNSYLNKHGIKVRLKPQTDTDMSTDLSRFELSPREQEIIRLILLGKTNKEIADELFISIKTVKNNIYNIFKRFNLKNRVQLTNFFRSS